MLVPSDFIKFTDKFHQDSAHGNSIEEWLDPKIKELSGGSREIILRYLKQIIDDQSSEAELKRAWLSGAASHGVDPGQWRAFFQMLLNRFENVK